MMLWPPQLIKDLARRRVVVVIGAGVSRHSTSASGARPPLWEEFLSNALKLCPNTHNLAPVEAALRDHDLLHACEWLKRRFDEQWTDHLRATFSQPAFPSAPIHEAILSLDSRIVFSLNFDDIYERHANGIHLGSYVVKNYHDPDVAEFLRGSRRYIIKVHGNLNIPDKLIFTQKDYSTARVKHSAFYQAFDATLLTHTFLFVGCGLSDPDINLLLENQNFGFPANSPHYFLTGSTLSEDLVQSIRANRNLKVLHYDKIDETHSGLVGEINNLSAQVEEERLDLSQNTTW